jgi:hypothetical protein
MWAMNATSRRSFREVVEFDADALNVRSALIGLCVLMVALALVVASGPPAIAAAIAALFVVAGASGNAVHTLTDQLLFVAVGTITTLVVGIASSSALGATIAIGLVALVSTLAALRSPVGAANGAYLLIWAVLSLAITDSDTGAAAMAGAFLVGGALAVAALQLAHKIAPADAAAAGNGRPDRAGIERYALIRAVGAATCVALGYWWFPDHAAWTAFAFVLVLRPPREHVIITGVGRTLGTIAGVLLGMLLALIVGDSDAVLALAFAACGFGMLLTSGVNYAVSTTFTTSLILLAQRIIEEDVVSTGWQRLGATLVGVVVAFVAIALIRRSEESTHEP